MKAWQLSRYGEPQDVLELAEVPRPEPGPGQLMVRLLAAAANFPDVLFCRGTYQVRPPLPFTPGVELCGQRVEQTVLLPDHGFVVVGHRVKRALCSRLAMATRQRVALQQPSSHACAALTDPKIFGDLVEADRARAKQQMPIKPGGDGRHAPRREQPSHVLRELSLIHVHFI